MANINSFFLEKLFLSSDLLTYSNPALDLAPSDFTFEYSGKPATLWQKFVGATKCRVFEHDWTAASGYANQHMYHWTDWRSGAYVSCRTCRVRKFEQLKTKDQLKEVLRIEHERWEKKWAEKSRRDAGE